MSVQVFRAGFARYMYALATSAIAVLSGCTGTTRPTITPQPPPTNSAANAYVYVADLSGIGRYPIVGGVMAAQPLSALKTSSNGNGAIAVAEDGTQYIADIVGDGRIQVNVWAKGASGNTPPQRQFYTVSSTQRPGAAIAVDRSNYVYLPTRAPANTVNVFSPGVQGLPKPVVTFGSFGEYASADNSGNMYVSNSNSGVTIWGSPSAHPQQVGDLCTNGLAAGVTALVGGKIYVATAGRASGSQAAIEVFTSRHSGCGDMHESFQTTPAFTDPTALAESGGQLFLLARNTASGSMAVFEIPKTGPNPRTPTTIVDGLPESASLAVGP